MTTVIDGNYGRVVIVSNKHSIKSEFEKAVERQVLEISNSLRYGKR